MQTFDIFYLSRELEGKLWGIETVIRILRSELKWERLELVRAIQDTKSYMRTCVKTGGLGSKVMNKEKVKDLKRGVYRLETLLFEMETSQLDPNTAVLEVRRIVGELSPYTPGADSFLEEERLVGRDFLRQKEELLGWILGETSSRHVVPILGRSGSGKHTLARLVFRDTNIMDYFDIIDSVSMRNITTLESTLTEIISYVLWASVDFGKEERKSDVNGLWSLLKQGFDGKRYLLLLEDVTDEGLFKTLLSEDTHHRLIHASSDNGSRVVITSTLELEDAMSIPFQIPRLTFDESWDLFQSIAFAQMSAMNQEERLPVLQATGIEICKKCDNIPGVVDIIASILSSKYTPDEWGYFLDVVMTSVHDPITTITFAVALISDKGQYSNKQTEARHYFAWCSLLPKDYVFQKTDLFPFWDALKFPYDRSKLLDEIFDEFIASGCFVQEGEGDRYKISCLGLELMKHVGGDEYRLVDEDSPGIIDDQIIQHASFIIDPSWVPPHWLSTATNLQSLLIWPRKSGDFVSSSKIDLSHIKSLRVLHLEAVCFGNVPLLLGNIQARLKYLRLGAVSFISFPDSILDLEKLLERYPQRDLGTQESEPALVLKVTDCQKLSTRLERCSDVISLQVTPSIMESLFAHKKLENWKSLEVSYLTGEWFPLWTTDEFSVVIRNLVSIQIANCSGYKLLPGFDTLPHLASLQLWCLHSLVEIAIGSEQSDNADGTKTLFYPSLKCLVLRDLPQLGGWSGIDVSDYCFPVLTEVKVRACPKLVSWPSMPVLDSLEATNIDDKLLNRLICRPSLQDGQATSSTQLSKIKNLEIDGCKDFDWGDDRIWDHLINLRFLTLTNIAQLVSLPIALERITTLEYLSLNWLSNLRVLPEWTTKLQRLTISYCPKLTTLHDSGDGPCSLEQLEILHCPEFDRFPESFPKLKKLRVEEFNGVEQLLSASQNLEELEIDYCEELEWDTQDVEAASSSFAGVWEGLKSLRSLKLSNIAETETFPKGVDFTKLSELRELVIQNCPKLTELPESVCSLSNLEHLHIQCCPGLEQLPSSLYDPESLVKLEIVKCPKLEKK